MRDNQQASALSRRTVLAALAAGAAANVPAIAAFATGDHPDRELLELGREYQKLEAAIHAADAVVKAYNEQEPQPRDVMRHRIEDHICRFNLPIGPNTRSLAADPQYAVFYSEDEIDELRDWPADRNPDERARVQVILAEWDRWNEECGGLNEALRVDEATEELEDLVPRRRQLAKLIAAMPAETPAGLQVRALILAAMLDEEDDEDDYTDQLMIRAIVRDLIKMKV
jgi:hypothetical protein